MVRASRVVSSMLAPIAPRRTRPGAAGPGRFALGKQHPETFLDSPGGADFLGRVTVVEHLAEPFPLLGTEVFGTGQEQPPVDPDRVGDGAAAAEQVRVTRCRTSVSIWFARATRCHLSTAISAFGSAARIPEAYGADGSITTISIAARNAGVCSASHS